MPNYEDKRARYRYSNPADFSATPHWDNPQQHTSRREPAVSSSTRPRDAFRVASAPAPPEPEPEPIPEPVGEPVPDESTWDL